MVPQSELHLTSQSSGLSKSSSPKRESTQLSLSPKNKPSFRQPQSFVTIKVDAGTARQSFCVHKQLLCHHSPMFHNAFNGKFVEAKTQTMEMNDVRSHVFGLLVHWLYTQQIEFDEPDKEGEQQKPLLLLAELWSLAEVAQIPALQNDVLRMIWGLFDLRDGNEIKVFLEEVNETCMVDCHLRKMVIAYVAWDNGLDLWMRAGLVPQGMIYDIVVALRFQAVHPDRSKGHEHSATDYFV